MTENWMVAELDPVRRLRVLAATVPGAMRYREIVLPAPMERVWAVASDLEGELPNLLPTVLSFRYTDTDTGTDMETDTDSGTGSADTASGTEGGDGARRTAHAIGRFGRHADFEVVLRPGWCVMRSRFVLGAMAAVPEDGGTRFATLGGLRVPAARLLRPLTGLLGATGLRRLAEHPGLRD